MIFIDTLEKALGRKVTFNKVFEPLKEGDVSAPMLQQINFRRRLGLSLLPLFRKDCRGLQIGM